MSVDVVLDEWSKFGKQLFAHVALRMELKDFRWLMSIAIYLENRGGERVRGREGEREKYFHSFFVSAAHGSVLSYEFF